jgi:alkylation response protein AidB-like acyl-CoA dehydrogenase
MDFELSEADEAFRQELGAFIEAELPVWWRGLFVDDDRTYPFTRMFCQELAERGWLTMSWPEEYGGRDASPWQQAVVREEMWAHGEPRGPQYMNLNYIGPMIMRFGTPEQKRRFLPPMARGDVFWAQGFSEPDAGSDLAALSTRAERFDDGYVVNGQKVWTTYADAPADWCILLVRTDTAAARHRGISVLLVDMTAPGITVRPIESMVGPHDLNEVFFEDVPVPADCLLGEENNGWELIVAGLTFERVGIARYARVGRVIEQLLDHFCALSIDGQRFADRPDVRMKLADLYTRYKAAQLLNYRAISLQAQGEVPAIESSIARVHNTLVEQLAGHVGMEILGPSALLSQGDQGAPIDGEMQRQWLEQIPATIAAGTLEVQKNIIAQRGLGLPRPS